MWTTPRGSRKTRILQLVKSGRNALLWLHRVGWCRLRTEQSSETWTAFRHVLFIILVLRQKITRKTLPWTGGGGGRGSCVVVRLFQSVTQRKHWKLWTALADASERRMSEKIQIDKRGFSSHDGTPGAPWHFNTGGRVDGEQSTTAAFLPQHVRPTHYTTQRCLTCSGMWCDAALLGQCFPTFRKT
jgi:hypothetical protein